ncbi:3-phenylpropionate-dihydrodiol/cinnamic acid-dihydrodiol dehydrogenase [Pseudomonas fluorescens]|uniref:SDR family NAD(P)-dependent oxidoreductase n=1 Tax=Pseudomonas tensinigenes TaxID=2745511 RepID=A0ABX8Q5B9_9PSED|nr:oxidoreductase [Pseudomonas tensinigenes]QXI08518.1 SDR family NAD(P)-dependent oxidoreductase [Pseudomonas tensinigenes]VVN24252.1 3-phenylpropionate-dihydrodiol/cinnamic acid-dihydrodiol dehydrogenase [Pseudomonas fluorescens]VVN55043.1 3-phenylpropionate-dihydrodiol/cinnamic acid-dihydrodiol dehydrogenase [Pseudomonas fluorescens]
MRTWFITGASRGFGILIAERALLAGDAVIATARNPQDITDRLGDQPNLLAVRLDVTREEEAHQAVAEGIKRFGRIDVLINNAGFGVLGAVEETSASETERLFATNVFGLLNVTRAVLPHMRAQRSGRVINISSIGGYQAYMGWGVYGSTKFAVEGITEALHQELAPLGIQATVVEPGFFRTDFLDEQSLIKTQLELPDYDETVGKMRAFAEAANHAQPGDPQKFAEAMLTLVNAPNPPLRLALGSDTVARIEAKNRLVAQELEQWQVLALSTDFNN